MALANYQALMFVAPFYGGFVFLIAIPPPLGLYIFIALAILSFVLVGGVPTYDNIVQRNFKIARIQPSGDESLWRWKGYFQWIYKNQPTSVWLPDLNPNAERKWVTKIRLEKPYAHPYYNRGRKTLYYGLIKHSIEDILRGEDLSGFSDDEKKEMGRWEVLSPKHGNFVVWGAGYVFYNSFADWFNADEVAPKREEMKLYVGKTPEARSKETPVTQIVMNHVPIIIDNKAHPLFQMTDCVNGYNLRRHVRERNLTASKALVAVGPKGMAKLLCPDCETELPEPEVGGISTCAKCGKPWNMKRPDA